MINIDFKFKSIELFESVSAVSVPGVCSSSSDLNRTLSISIVEAVVKMVLTIKRIGQLVLKV